MGKPKQQHRPASVRGAPTLRLYMRMPTFICFDPGDSASRVPRLETAPFSLTPDYHTHLHHITTPINPHDVRTRHAPRHESAGDSFQLSAPPTELSDSHLRGGGYSLGGGIGGVCTRKPTGREVSRHVRAVRESIAILAPVSASSSSSGSESSDDDAAPGQTGTHHHHHHHHADNSDEEVEEKEAKYKANDRVMFKHRLVGVGMVHAVALVTQVKTHWLSIHTVKPNPNPYTPHTHRPRRCEPVACWCANKNSHTPIG